MSTPPALHPIKVVVRQSGVSADLLRAWEKRYGAVTPVRSDTGRRLYSDADIERLRLIRLAMAGGRRVSDVATLPTHEIAELVGADRDRSATIATRQVPPANAHYMTDALAATRRADQTALSSVLSRALVALTPSRFVDELAAPFMHKLGELWLRGEIGSGHEHAASEVMRRLMSDVMSMLPPKDDAPGLVMATLAGQRHEIGAMFAAAAAALLGWRVTYLGVDLPAADIARVARDANALAIAISITTATENIYDEVATLREHAGPEFPIIVGGQASQALTEASHKVTVVSDIDEFRAILQALAPTTR